MPETPVLTDPILSFFVTLHLLLDIKHVIHALVLCVGSEPFHSALSLWKTNSTISKTI